MDVLSLETSTEAEVFLGLCQGSASLFEKFTHIGGITLAPKHLSTWYWVDSGKRIEYPLKFAANQPDNFNNIEYCLSIQKEPGDVFAFNDIECNTNYEVKFICQKVEDVIHKVNSEWDLLRVSNT